MKSLDAAAEKARALRIDVPWGEMTFLGTPGWFDEAVLYAIMRVEDQCTVAPVLTTLESPIRGRMVR